MQSSASSLSSLTDSTSTSSKWNFSFFNRVQSQTVGDAESSFSSSPVRTSDASTLDAIEQFFGRFWTELAVFSFDRAKEITEKEKENSSKQQNVNWTVITNALVQLSLAEKAYLNLLFLAPKGFLRKEYNIKNGLELMKADLRKLSDSVTVVSSSKYSNSDVASALLIFVNFRLDMMEFYEKLSLYGSAKNVEISDLITDIETTIEKFEERISAIGETVAVIQGIVKSLKWESQILCNLLKAINAMETWSYLEATIAIQLMNSALQEWTELIQSNSTIVRKSTFYSSTPTLPSIFLWIKKFKGALVSKYTLYFYELLARHSNPMFDIKNYCSKLSTDYYNRLCTFRKKWDALYICLVFEAKGTSFYKHGYRFPGRKIEQLEGMDSLYPCILSIPSKPTSYWPSIVMIVNDKTKELSADKTVAIFDSSAQVTYFAQKLDVRVYLLILYDGKRSEKDANTLKFITDLAIELKGAKIFASLKNFKS